MLRKDNDHRGYLQKQKSLVVILKGFDATVISNRYLARASEPTGDFICAVIIEIRRVCKSVCLLKLLIPVVNSCERCNSVIQLPIQNPCLVTNTWKCVVEAPLLIYLNDVCDGPRLVTPLCFAWSVSKSMKDGRQMGKRGGWLTDWQACNSFILGYLRNHYYKKRNLFHHFGILSWNNKKKRC
jgi:hypothetical protein